MEMAAVVFLYARVSRVSIAAFLACLLLPGCAIQRHSVIQHDRPPFVPDEVKTVRIESLRPWTHTGIWLEVGDSVLVDISGTWHVAHLDEVGPAGGLYLNNLVNPLDWIQWALVVPIFLRPVGPRFLTLGEAIAKVGNSPARVAGEQMYIDSVRTGGELLLGCNENYLWYWDNTGYMTARISVKRAAHQPPVSSPNTEQAVARPPEVFPLSGRYAVVIGVSQYKDPAIPRLQYAAKDARDFSGVLREKLGWEPDNIRLLTDEQATFRNVKVALTGFLTKARGDGLAVLFWSGHGYADPTGSGEVYLATHDMEKSHPGTGYNVDDLCRDLAKIGARNVVVVADACHAGRLMFGGLRGEEYSRAIGVRINKMPRTDVPEGSLFMLASESSRKAIEDRSWSNGAFTHCLLNGLAGEADGPLGEGTPDGVVTLGELRNYLRVTVPRETEKVLGKAVVPTIQSPSPYPEIWNLSLSGK